LVWNATENDESKHCVLYSAFALRYSFNLFPVGMKNYKSWTVGLIGARDDHTNLYIIIHCSIFNWVSYIWRAFVEKWTAVSSATVWRDIGCQWIQKRTS